MGIAWFQNQIYKAYQEQSRTQQKRLQASLIAVSFLFLVLIGALLFIRKQMRRLKEANLKLDSTNQKLSVNRRVSKSGLDKCWKHLSTKPASRWDIPRGSL